jgi:hypothetical protein
MTERWKRGWRRVISDARVARKLCGPAAASRIGKKRDAPLKESDWVEAQVRAAFVPYLEFRAALLQAERVNSRAPYRRDKRLAYESLWARQNEMEVALIVALAKIWQEWKGTSPRTVGTDTKTSRLKAGEFPFGKWVVGLFKAAGEKPPSRYAIQNAIELKKRRLASLSQPSPIPAEPPYKLEKVCFNMDRDVWAQLREAYGSEGGAARVVRLLVHERLEDLVDQIVRRRGREVVRLKKLKKQEKQRY